MNPLKVKQHQSISSSETNKQVNDDSQKLLGNNQLEITNNTSNLNEQETKQPTNILTQPNGTNMINVNNAKQQKLPKRSFICNYSNQQTPKSISTSKRADLVLAYLSSSREIPQSVVQCNKKLKIIQEEGNLFVNNVLTLNAAGPIDGGRKAKDGVTLFGNNTNLKADYTLNLDSSPNLDIYKTCPYIFAIYFQKESGSYFIRSYTGEGCDSRIFFVKLNSNYDIILNRREIISIGNSIFQFTPLDEDNLEINILAMKDPSINNSLMETKRFFDKNHTQIITIGRDSKCTYSFKNDKSYSRIQTTITYENGKWVIRDGSGVRESTNGTWVFGLHSFVIKNNMIVEVLSTKIKFLFDDNNSDK